MNSCNNRRRQGDARHLDPVGLNLDPQAVA